VVTLLAWIIAEAAVPVCLQAGDERARAGSDGHAGYAGTHHLIAGEPSGPPGGKPGSLRSESGPACRAPQRWA